MLQLCNIFCPYKEDFDVFTHFLNSYPVYIHHYPLEEYNGLPTIIVGWDYVKKHFPQQNIWDKKINETVFWVFSSLENEKQAFEECKFFVEDFIRDWLPSYDQFELYDPLINREDIFSFFKKKDYQLYSCYYYNSVLYISSYKENFIINLKSFYFLYGTKKTKSLLCDLINYFNIYPFSYTNIYDCVDLVYLKKFSIKSLFWVKFCIDLDEKKYFNILSNFFYQKYIPFLSFYLAQNIYDFSKEEILFLQRMRKRDKITAYCSNTLIPLKKDSDIKENERIIKPFYECHFINLKFSDKRTITNRIVCKDSFNIQNEPKDSFRRTHIISQFKNGRILVCDYVSFETRISLLLTGDIDFINQYKDEDIHYLVAYNIFNKKEISYEEREIAKNFCHALIYGASHKKLTQIIKGKVKDPEKSIYFVKKIFQPIIDDAKRKNEHVKKYGYIKTKWGIIIYPEKDYAGYQNLIQASASEIIIDKINKIKTLLSYKKSSFLFQVHDSLVFDISPDEKNIVKDILSNLSYIKKNVSFPVSYKLGQDYFHLKNEKIFKK